MKQLSKNETIRLLDIIYEKCECGSITPTQQMEAVEKVESQSPEFTENIIDDQIDRLEKMHKDGKISDDVYKSQIEKWNSKRELYEKNLKEAKLKEEIERRKEARNPINRLKKAVAARHADEIGRFKPATESVLNFFKDIQS